MHSRILFLCMNKNVYATSSGIGYNIKGTLVVTCPFVEDPIDEEVLHRVTYMLGDYFETVFFS